jgi:hypothetical protein
MTGDTTTIFVGQIIVLAFVAAAAVVLIYLGLKGSSQPDWWNKPWDAEEREWPRRPSGGGELLPKEELVHHG